MACQCWPKTAAMMMMMKIRRVMQNNDNDQVIQAILMHQTFPIEKEVYQTKPRSGKGKEGGFK